MQYKDKVIVLYKLINFKGMMNLCSKVIEINTIYTINKLMNKLEYTIIR